MVIKKYICIMTVLIALNLLITSPAMAFSQVPNPPTTKEDAFFTMFAYREIGGGAVSGGTSEWVFIALSSPTSGAINMKSLENSYVVYYFVGPTYQTLLLWGNIHVSGPIIVYGDNTVHPVGASKLVLKGSPITNIAGVMAGRTVSLGTNLLFGLCGSVDNANGKLASGKVCIFLQGTTYRFGPETSGNWIPTGKSSFSVTFTQYTSDWTFPFVYASP
jgi:hypothetical protein